MGIILFTSPERGTPLSSGKILHPGNVLDLGALILHSGGTAEIIGPDTARNITPAAFTHNRNEYWLTTEADDPVVSATLHAVPINTSEAALTVDMEGIIWDSEGVRHTRVPEDTHMAPILSPMHGNPDSMLLHQLVVPTFHFPSQTIIEAMHLRNRERPRG